jgi:hypothetical protein
MVVPVFVYVCILKSDLQRKLHRMLYYILYSDKPDNNFSVSEANIPFAVSKFIHSYASFTSLSPAEATLFLGRFLGFLPSVMFTLLGLNIAEVKEFPNFIGVGTE